MPIRPASLYFDISVFDDMVAVAVAAVSRPYPFIVRVFVLNVTLAMPFRQIPPSLDVYLFKAAAAPRSRLTSARIGTSNVPAVVEGYDSDVLYLLC